MIKHINEQEFEEEVLNSDGVVLVDFFGTWCMPCRMLSSVLEDVDKKLKNQIKICKIDIDENMNLTRKYGVMSVPTVLIYKSGVEAEKFVGLLSEKDIIDLIKPYLD